jgi:hypothetical protein
MYADVLELFDRIPSAVSDHESTESINDIKLHPELRMDLLNDPLKSAHLEINDLESKVQKLLVFLSQWKWFSRMWTTQEPVLGKTSRVFWGRRIIPWENLVDWNKNGVIFFIHCSQWCALLLPAMHQTIGLEAPWLLHSQHKIIVSAVGNYDNNLYRPPTC